MSLVATTATATATATAIVIAAASAAATVGTFFAYLYFVLQSEAHAARDEAMALAETRGEVIADLRRRLRLLERLLRDTTEALERRVRELEATLQRTEAEAREHAYGIQRFYAASLSEFLRTVQADLEQDPANVQRALSRVRQLLDDERPAA
jgi:hypothetical protein